MKKFTSLLIKVSVVSALVAPLAYAAESVVAESALAEPIYLSACGIILLVLGTLKAKTESDA
jgi:hypothetical protein